MNSSAIYPSLRDAPVLVTGGASGIGATITRAFCAQGARVAFIDIEAERGQALVAELADAIGGPPLFQVADVTNISRFQSAIRDVEERLGAVRVLVNNAANDQRHDFGSVTSDEWDSRMNVNLRHHFFAAQAVASGMAAAGGGSIINLGSCSWRLGLGGMPVYLTAKAGVEGLTRALATELGPKRIRVNCIVPGFVRTERTIRDFLTPELEAQVLGGQRLPDLVDDTHVAAMALFLGAEDSARCTNQTYAVDGGWM